MSDEDALPFDQQEDLEDLGESGRQYTAVINQADWTTQTIVQQINKGNIELNPSFQRREAWRIKRKSQYIESLMINVPVPQIVLAEKKNERGKFIVIDGKQRLLALRQFYAKSDDLNFKSFRLTDLTIRTDLNGVDYERLSTDLLREADLNSLENSTIRTAVIRNWQDEKFLFTVFLRLNTGSVQLSPQELRQALHPGPFVTFVDDYSMLSKEIHQAMHIDQPDVRMRDAELVIRYYAFRNFLHTYTGNLTPLLDATAKYFNENWDLHSAKIHAQQRELEFSITKTINIFGEDVAFRKWSGNRFEAALNRAIFDVMIYYFIDVEVAQAAVERKEQIVTAFKELCLEGDFKSSIEGTTKSIEAIYTRLTKWGATLEKIIEKPIKKPKLVDFKIVRE